MNFHNTINEKGNTLKESREKAESQQDKILSFFQIHCNKVFTPFEVLNQLFDNNTPITSVRRSMTNLEKSGQLVKTDIQKEGLYGKNNYCWKFHIKKPYQKSLFE